jgi:hypothetical protein
MLWGDQELITVVILCIGKMLTELLGIDIFLLVPLYFKSFNLSLSMSILDPGMFRKSNPWKECSPIHRFSTRICRNGMFRLLQLPTPCSMERQISIPTSQHGMVSEKVRLVPCPKQGTPDNARACFLYQSLPLYMHVTYVLLCIQLQF